MNITVRLQLSIMMFIQFFIWGSWYVTAPSYLGTIGFGGPEFGWTYSVGPIAGMISPFFVGMIADRYFAAQRVLGVMHILGSLLMLGATGLMKVNSPSPSLINLIFFGHMLTYFPTLALTNTIAMKNMTDSEKEFPGIRVLGTIGWIVAGLTLSWLGWSTKINMFYLTIGSGFILGIFSFFLPHTPPNKDTKVTFRQIIGLDAFVLLKDKSYLVFMVCSMLICIPLAFYYQIAARVVQMTDFSSIGFFQFVKKILMFNDVIGAVMSMGQVSEIVFMLLMPFFFRRLGVKWMLAVGMLAWVLRYLLFAVGAPDEIRWMVLVGVLLHGICYDFFFVTGQIYTDQIAPKPIRAQAQGMLVLFTLGLGMAIGAQIAGQIEAQHTPTPDALVAKASDPAQLEKLTRGLGSAEEAKLVLEDWRRLAEIDLQLASLSEELLQAPESGKSQIAEQTQKLSEERALLSRSELRAKEWKPLWSKPALFAAGVLVLFLILFRDNRVRGQGAPGKEPGASVP